jgi:hypothetical protein
MSVTNLTKLFHFLALATLLVAVVGWVRGKEAFLPAPQAPAALSQVTDSVPATVTKTTRVSTPATSSCAGLSNAGNAARDKCYLAQAVQRKDAKLCQNILAVSADDAGNYTKQTDYNDCMVRVSFALNTPSVCQQITDLNDRYFCLIQLAGAKRDKNICALLPNSASGGQDTLWNRASCNLQVEECGKPGVNCGL